jgi:hypothetical protein
MLAVSDPLFTKFAPLIRGLTASELGGPQPPSSLLIQQSGKISIFYAPFDAVNTAATITLVGITPGRSQMDTALREAARHLAAGMPDAEVLHRAKATASFAGPMRANLSTMLDYFRVNELLGLASCAQLFGPASHLVHYTSALRYPVFINGENYKGSPDMTRDPMLSQHLLKYFADELTALSHSIVIPLGDKVAEAIKFVSAQRGLSLDRVLFGLEHPSGANNERIAYLIGRKDRGALSSQVRPDRIDAAREVLRAKVSELAARGAARR